MLPTLEVLRDSVLIDLWYRRGRGIKVGDIISFDTVYEPGGRSIKRVLGVEGDYVLRDTPNCEGDVMLQVSGQYSRGAVWTDLAQIPRGHCWVVGDNLPSSKDSRTLGPIPMAVIRGKVNFKVGPWKERKCLENSLNPVSQ